MDVNEFEKLPVMGILRGISINDVEPILDTILKTKLKTIEITMNTENAGNIIKKIVDLSNGKLTIGAGTVLTITELMEALDNGASYIVSPILARDVAVYCINQSIPVFPGAFTPQEIYNAWKVGVTMVKVFPSKVIGPEFFKEIKGPFNNIKLMACGGVNPDNIASFFNNGADAVAFGASIFNPGLIKEKKFTEIGNRINKLINNLPVC